MTNVFYDINVMNNKDEDIDEVEDIDKDEDNIIIDSSWLDEYETIAKEYGMFYTEELAFIKTHYIYINDENEIEKVKEDKVLLKTPGILSRDELITIMKTHSSFNQHKYSILSILKYNLNIDPRHLKNYMKTKNVKAGYQFLHSMDHIENIKFDKSITFFHDINELFILFHQKSLSKHVVFTQKNRPSQMKATRRQRTTIR